MSSHAVTLVAITCWQLCVRSQKNLTRQSLKGCRKLIIKATYFPDIATL